MIKNLLAQAVGILLLCPLLSTSLLAQQLYYPERGNWQAKAPATMGVDAEKLQKAVNFALDHEYQGARDLRITILKGFEKEPYHYLAGPVKERGGPAGIIIKDGYIIAQWGDINRVDMTFSVTKSYLSTTAGLALDSGLISNVQDPVGAYIWDDTFAGKHNSQISWEHLLTQSSDWSGSLFGMHDWADRPPAEGSVDEWKNRKLLKPGTNFEYNDVRVNVLAYALLQLWRKPLPMVLKENIMDPIGASSSWRWYGYENSFVNIDGIMMQSVSGGGHSGGGLFINTLDQARFGLLFLRKGKWQNQQLISEKWVEQVQQPSVANESYGFMWWLNKGDGPWEGVEDTVYYAAGFGGNFIVIDEAHQMVVVTRWLDPPQIGEMIRLATDAFIK